MIVFASGNNTPDAKGNLHTNFSLSSAGEALEFTDPSGAVINGFSPGGLAYPAQMADVSYGTGTVYSHNTLLSTTAAAKAIVLKDSSLDADTAWTLNTYNDSAWTSGTSGIGFDTGGAESLHPIPTTLADWSGDGITGISAGGAITNWTSTVAGTTYTATQSTTSQKPTFQSATANKINGHNVVRFDGVNDMLKVAKSASPMSNTDDFSIAVVYKTSSVKIGADNQWYNNTGLVDGYAGTVTNDWGMGISSAGHVAAGMGGSDVTAYGTSNTVNGVAHVALFTRNDDSFTLYVDGGDGVTQSGSDTTRGSFDMAFGALATGANFYGGDIAEILVYRGAADTTAAYQMSAALGTKYAVAIAAPSTGAAAVLSADWTADSIAQSSGSTVSTWISSGGPTNFTASRTAAGTPTSAANAPKLITAANASLNGHAVVRFDPTDGTATDQLRVTSGPISGKTDYTVAVVFRTSATTNAGGTTNWWANSGVVDSEVGGVTNDWGLAITAGGNIGAGQGNINGTDATVYSGAGLNDGNAHVAVYSKSGTTISLSIDGGNPFTGVGTATARNTIDMVFGSIQTNAAGLYYKGDLAEVRTYTGGMDSDSMKALGSQLGLTYGVTQPPSQYTPKIGLNLQTAMAGQATNAAIRETFTVENPASIDKLTLNMNYDDGFIAYLNGTEVARRNVPGSVQYTDTATQPRADSQALTQEAIDLSSYRGLLLGTGQTNVLAIRALNSSLTDPDLLIIPELTAQTGSAGTGYMPTPTPGSDNSEVFIDTVAPVSYSVGRGNYTSAQVVDLTDTTPGATIVYTTDSSMPSLTNGVVVKPNGAVNAVAHVSVSGTTVIRARAFKDTYLPSSVTANSYVYLANTLTQGAVQPAGAYWYTVVDQSKETGQQYPITDALTALPTISLSVPDADMFGTNGIYANPLQKGTAWEREGSVEWFDPKNPAAAQFQVDAGVRIEGGAARDLSHPKKSFKLFFRSDYGTGKLDFPVMGSATTYHTYDALILRATNNYSWANDGNSGTDYARDEFARELLGKENGGHTLTGTWAELYVNGLYWGVYNVAENLDTTYLANQYGGDEGDYDILEPANDGTMQVKDSASNVTDPNNSAGTAYSTLYAKVTAAASDGVISAAEYADIGSRVDLQSVVDYMLNTQFRGDRDAPAVITNSTDPRNHFVYRDAAHGGKFKFQVWDGELSMDSTTFDRSEISGNLNPAAIWHALRGNADFAQLVSDSLYRLASNNGPMTVANMQALYQSVTSKIDVAIEGESIRWGDGPTRGNSYTRANWLSATSTINSYIASRYPVWVGQLNVDMPVTAIAAPALFINGTQNQTGGTVTAGSKLTITDSSGPAGDVIYYTADGTDPRLTGGTVAATAKSYTAGAQIPIVQNTTFNVRVLRTNGTWSPLVTATYGVNISTLRVAEMMYHPAKPATGAPSTDRDQYEWLEFMNVGTTDLNLSGITTIDPAVSTTAGVGITFTFPAGTTLAAGQRGVIVKNMAAFQYLYPSVPASQILGVYTDKLSDSGEEVKFIDPSNANKVVVDFNYLASWYPNTDGSGYSMVVKNLLPDQSDPATATANSLSNSTNWRQSGTVAGSPGSLDNVVDNNSPPRVISAAVGSTVWSGIFNAYLGDGGYVLPGGASQALPVPWSDVNQIKIKFDQAVNVGQGDLSVTASTGSYSVIGFSYNDQTATATWTLNTPIVNDKVRVTLSDAVTGNLNGSNLDGEWVDNTTTNKSGNGLAGGPFKFRINVLPGDVDQSRTVLATDAAVIQSRLTKNTVGGGYSVLADLNGDGYILANDAAAVKKNLNKVLPSTEPA